MAAAPRSPRSRAAAPSQPAVIAADDGADIDPMEWILAVVYAIVIPLVTYVVLSSLFSSGMSREEEMLRNEAIQKVEAPVTVREIEIRLQRIRPILEKNVPEFMKRAQEQEEPNDVHRVCRYAYRALGWCKAELEIVLADAVQSSEVRARPEVEQEIRRFLAKIESEQAKVRKLTPHPDDLPANPVPGE